MAMDSLGGISPRLSEIISQRAELLARLTVLESFDGDLSTLPEFKEGRLGEIHARIETSKRNSSICAGRILMSTRVPNWGI